MVPNLISGSGAGKFAAAVSRKGVAVILKWAVATGGTVDRTTGGQVGGSVSEGSETVKGFVDFNVAKSMIHHFQNYQEGDCIVDLLPDVVIEGRADLTFTIDGVEYSQKEIGAEGGGNVVPQFLMQAGVKIYRTVYLKRIG